jgi:hypothetical protein
LLEVDFSPAPLKSKGCGTRSSRKSKPKTQVHTPNLGHTRKKDARKNRQKQKTAGGKTSVTGKNKGKRAQAEACAAGV